MNQHDRANCEECRAADRFYAHVVTPAIHDTVEKIRSSGMTPTVQDVREKLMSRGLVVPKTKILNIMLNTPGGI